MKSKKRVMILTILSATSLFATNNIDYLVNKINKTDNIEKRINLSKELDKKLSSMGQEDLLKAQQIINTKLNISKII